MKKWIERIFWVVIVVLGIFIFYPAYDDTDDQPKGLRSGVTLITDYGTGCQYLKTPGFLGIDGSITPRLLPDGKPLCYPSLVRQTQRDGSPIVK